MKLVFGTHCRLFPAKTKQSEGVYSKSMMQGDPIPDSILLTREQFNELRAKIAGDAFEAGEGYGYDLKLSSDLGNNPTEPNKHQYLSSLNTNQ